MKRGTSSGNASDVERLHRADLVVGALERDRGHAGVDRTCGERAGGHAAHLVARHLDRLADPRRRVPDGRVLDRGVQHRRTAPRPADEPEQPAVDRLGAGAGEAHLVRSDVEALGHHGARVVEQQAGVAPGPVQPARVGPALVQGGQQRVARGGVQGLGGRRVELGTAVGHGANVLRAPAVPHPLDGEEIG